VLNRAVAAVAVERSLGFLQNHVWVSGLEPETDYRYRVLVDGRPWGEGELHDWSVEQATLVLAGGRYDNRFRTFPSSDVAVR
jgi:hypothetical protein